VDFSAAQKYLGDLRDLGMRVTVQHLLTAAIGRVYKEYPMANSHVLGEQIIRHEHVGVAIPVNLDGNGKFSREIGLILVEKAEQMSLYQLAQHASRRLREEHNGKQKSFVFSKVLPLVERCPSLLLRGFFDIFGLAMRLPAVANWIHRIFPLTILISNPGAAFSTPQGCVIKGAAISLPQRVFSLGTYMAVFPIQDEVLAIDGQAVVRPVLPLTYFFDHRLFDGVLCGKIISRLVEILRDPVGEFGADGQK
jgi:pyruvate/2-oxoglutarate dehydrogenase complex dihydrolipoamide acyltransferase (E2) component